MLLDPAFDIVWLNDAYSKVTMRTAEELLGRNMFEAFPSDPESDSYRQLSTSLLRVLDSGERDEIALIHYPIANPDGTLSARYWSATHTPLKGPDGKVSHILQHTVDVTELHELRTLRDDAGIMQRAREVEKSSAEARDQLGRMRITVDQAPGFVAILVGPNHRFELANAAYRRLVGGRELLGKSVAEVLPEVVAQGFVDLLDTAYRTGKPYIGRRVPVMLRSEAGGGVEERFLDFVYQPIVGADGNIAGIYVQGQDVTDETRAAEQQAVLINELNHRVKNTLAIVQGLAMQSFRTVDGGDGAYRVFNQRLEALSAAHSLLTDRKWEAASLSEVLQGALNATLGDKVAQCRIHGEDAELGPQTAVALAMLLHELATNAIKYGALSREGGGVDVETAIETSGDEPMMKLVWRETGGPPVVAPEKAGFGTRLIRRGVANHREASVALDYAPDGLVCTIVGAVS